MKSGSRGAGSSTVENPMHKAAGGKSSGGQWKELTDQASGKTYYVNKETRETTWQKPPGFSGGGASKPAAPKKSAAAAAKAAAGGGQQWVAKLDAGSGKTYYYDKASRETTWKKPLGFDGSAGAKSGAKKPAKGGGEALPAGWVEVMDKARGKPYYYHKASKETSWKRPT